LAVKDGQLRTRTESAAPPETKIQAEKLTAAEQKSKLYGGF
jgi:hypothetical protein